MQIDFHHTVTYVAARMAGFTGNDAGIIAYAAQYVDDATSEGTISFNNKARFTRISTAHKMLNLKNINYTDGLKVWQPFHFLAGNANKPWDKNPDGTFIDKLICHPNSPVALDMVDAALADRSKPYGLHRLGIAMHVYADTWAHQGFAGVRDEVNNINDVQAPLDELESEFLERMAPPVGHGQAGALPDMPFLKWSYANSYGNVVHRDNTEDFTVAANALCKVMQKYRNVPETGIDKDNLDRIRALFVEQTSTDGEERHDAWIKAIAGGTFAVGAGWMSETVSYEDDGPKSWKWQALGTDENLESYPWKQAFATSNWKYFHDAVQAHRFAVMHDILPKYGIFVG